VFSALAAVVERLLGATDPSNVSAMQFYVEQMTARIVNFSN